MMLGLAFLCLLFAASSESKSFTAVEKRARSYEAKLTQPRYVFEDFNKPSLHATDPTDKEVLIELYDFTAGSSWLQNSGWLSGDPCQSMWYGVVCNETGNVLEITLANNRLVGELPNKLSKLKSIQVLRLYNNMIGGTLPQSLFTIQTLKILDIDNNLITGSLPMDLSMPHLKNLSIANNRLVGYLPYRWNSPNIESISLHSNTFQGPIPAAISTASKLKYLDISNNYFVGSLPPQLGQLSSLETLLIFNNPFGGNVNIPIEWAGLTAMKNFQADNLGGKLLELIGTWRNLERLVLTNGNLTGDIPETFCSLQNLNTLVISRHSITGVFPKCFCKLSANKFTSIDLSYNHISGTLPDCFHNLHNLTSINMGNNNISGPLPLSLGSCKELSTIDLSYNRLTGSIPFTFANLVNVKEFDVETNKLNSIDNGLEDFFKKANEYFYCSLYDNPWSCPLPDYFNDIRCGATCSKCNSPDKHNSCTACVASSECGWCTEGPNCLEGTIDGPSYIYQCMPANWIYGLEAECKN